MRSVLFCFLLACAGAASAADASAPAPARLPFKQSAEQDDALVWRALGAFVVACAAAGALAYGIKRAAPGLPRFGVHAGVLEKMASMRLSPKSTLFVVRYRGEELLVAEDGHGLRLLRGAASAEEQPIKNA